MSLIDDHALPNPAFRFDAFLHPHRSLSVTGFWMLMATLTAISLTVGGVFLAAGAWPIFGFYGLDVVIVYFALRQSYRNARIYEKVRLTDETLLVEKGDHEGSRQVWEFQPYWLKVTVDDPEAHHRQVRLTSHGRSVTVGSFLSPEERADFAEALRRALDDLKRRLPQESGG